MKSDFIGRFVQEYDVPTVKLTKLEHMLLMLQQVEKGGTDSHRKDLEKQIAEKLHTLKENEEV